MLKNYLKNSGCGYYAGKRNNFFNYNFLENLHGDQQLFNGSNWIWIQDAGGVGSNGIALEN